jgi:3-oxoacyl-[acyl-carrier protein] reductase
MRAKDTDASSTSAHLGKNGGNARRGSTRVSRRRRRTSHGVSKAGVHAMTMFLARELADAGITVNAVAPGPIASNMTANFPQRLRDLIPVGRMARRTKLRGPACFWRGIVSYITAEILDVNGGMWGD